MVIHYTLSCLPPLAKENLYLLQISKTYWWLYSHQEPIFTNMF